jgi:hypothetical protein
LEVRSLPPKHTGYGAAWQRAWFGTRKSEVRILLSRLMTTGRPRWATTYGHLLSSWRSNSTARVPACRAGGCGFESRLCRRAAHIRRVRGQEISCAYPERLGSQHCADCETGSLALWSVPGRRTKKPSSLPLGSIVHGIGSRTFNPWNWVRVPVELLIRDWCNGSTQGFGPCRGGSNPSSRADAR